MHLDVGKSHAQLGDLERNGFERVMMPARCENVNEPEDVTGCGSDIDAVGVRAKDAPHGFHCEDVVPAIRALDLRGPPMEELSSPLRRSQR
jgi:hypothetical protein